MSFRGIQLLCATVIAAEIGDLRRFKSAWQFMAFLVEAAQHYRHRPVLSAAIRKRQEGISKQVLDISWEAQQRLCSRRTHFTNSGKARNKAIVALARE